MSDNSAKPSLMGIFAHPDDESFGLAGSMARYTAAGHRVAIVSATRGEEGQIADAAQATPANLGVVREQELRAACAAVGVSDVSFLDYIDGHVAEADTQEAIGRIVYHIRRFRPDVVATFEANGGYGHVDHIAIHDLTLAAIAAAADGARYPEHISAELRPHRVRKVYFTAIPREQILAMRDRERAQGRDFLPGGDEATLTVEQMGTPVAEITSRITLADAEYEAKMRSMLAHATQMPADSFIRTSPPAELRAFLGVETLVLAPPPISDRAYPTPETDLFAGL